MDLDALVQLGGTVVTVAIFIWYLRDKNGKQERAMDRITASLDNINTSQQTHTRVLMRVAKNHGLDEDADSLMVGNIR